MSAELIASSIIGGTIVACFNQFWNFIQNRDKAELEKQQQVWEKQTIPYIELWKSLNALKITAERLWLSIDFNDLKLFNSQLGETYRAINDHSILLDEQHHKRLIDVIEAFEKYYIGKKSLGEYVQSIIKEPKPDMKDLTARIQKMTKVNEEHRKSYYKLLAEIEIDFRGKLRTA